ncbi:fatty acyl-CoA reductase wat-like isoform X3 [Temnothorax americanus]|uniref:fatty acyl-CoA reductase wat-like isoform X3 n=1 Tax=Temnothorax americanus TaxID=1964332 RepID=UPI004067BE88
MTRRNKDYLEDMLNMSDLQDTNDCQSEIPEFFAGCNVLITGGSGFLGLLLIEKLLRCCPDIGKLYVFMRAKKEKSPEQRIKEHFDNPVYDRLKKEQPNFSTKIIMIEADLSKLDLGLSQENRERLLDTNVIFHVAATVRFNEAIRIAVNINVRGTKQLLLIAKEMPNLKAFVYVSSAFAYCVHNFIEEKYYPPPIETDKILTLIDILDDEKLDKFTPTLIGKWPNSYTYTKAIAEDTVRQYSVGIPTCIVRPSIVTSTAEEPVEGWINNVYGAVGVVMGSAVGLLRTLHCDPENVAEIVPADYVISHFIAASWDTAKRKLVKAYKKIDKFSSVISHFSTRQWRFSNDAVVKLWSRVNPADRQIFNFNIDNLSWDSYLRHMIPGMRVYIVKDPMSTLDQGREKYRKLKIAHYTLLTVITILLVWGVISLLIRIMSFF